MGGEPTPRTLIYHELMCFSHLFLCTSRRRALPRAHAPGALAPARSRSRHRLPWLAGPEPLAKRGKKGKPSEQAEQKWGIHPLKACHSHYVHPFLSSRYFFICVVFFVLLPPPS